MHGSLLKDKWSEATTMLANDLLKLNNITNTCLTNPNILYYSFSLDIYKYPEYHQHDSSINNRKIIHISI